MLSHVRRIVGASLALLLAASGDVARAQTPFLRGQGVQPVYEGFQKNADGTISMVFGYLNRNFREEPFIPVGANNFFEPGPQDRGQPTHFDPRRQSFIFMVKLPVDWGNKDLVWTINHNGRTATAIGSLLPSWIIDEVRGAPTAVRASAAARPTAIPTINPRSFRSSVRQASKQQSHSRSRSRRQPPMTAGPVPDRNRLRALVGRAARLAGSCCPIRICRASAGTTTMRRPDRGGRPIRTSSR